jgi:NitT/TauT family transport system substrate-binding protein
MPDRERFTVLAPVPHPTTNFAPVWLAEALGYARDEGLDLRIVIAGSPKDAANGIESGRGDTTFINIVFTLLARDRGAALRPYYAFVRTQNRSFSVPEGSAIRALADLRGKIVGLHYDDPELVEFAKAGLRGVGINPDTEVIFKTLPGTPLDAPRMAAAIRDGYVDAIWQLDVLAGFMEEEGVPLRLLPSELMDRLTPSSSFNALDESLERRPEAFGRFGRALAKATLFALTSPEAAIRLMWARYPEAAPAPGEDFERAFRRELAALKVRSKGHRIDAAPVPRWGAISKGEMAAWQEFLLRTGAVGTRRPAEAYYSDVLVDAFNAFDPRSVVAAAKESSRTITPGPHLA